MEQRLFADLPLLAARAATESKVEAAVEADGARFAVEVEAQLFADAAQPFYRELVRLARSARIAGQGAALVLPAESRRWPGFLPRLLELEQDGLVIAPAGLAAVAAIAARRGRQRRRRVCAAACARVADHSARREHRIRGVGEPRRRRARCRSRTSCSAATRCASRTSVS